MTNSVSDFLEAMGAAGVRPLEPISDKLASGQPVRFRADGDKPGRRNGWAWLHLDGVPAGVFRHYRLGVRAVWRAGSDTSVLTPAERREIMATIRESEQRRQAATLAKQRATAVVARDLWRNAGEPASDHSYLVRKGLPPFGVRQWGQALLVPMIDNHLNLWNVQRIYPDGAKRFLRGGRTDGMFWSHRTFQQVGSYASSPLVIGEGFATMAAIHHATGHSVVAAMSARNLESVAKTMRELFPARTLIIAADDDRHLEDNIGLTAAQLAAGATGALLATPLPLSQGIRQSGRSSDFASIARQDIQSRIDDAKGAGHA